MPSRPRAALRTLIAAGASGSFIFPFILGVGGCAHSAAPPGGPPDSVPPLLIMVEPESLSVVPGYRDNEVRFEFDESISEQDIQTAATIFPFEARPRIKKGKRDIRVRPRAGWLDGTIYHVEISPVVRDLFRNSIKDPIHYVFSTGPPLTTNGVSGIVNDRITGRALTGGRVDLVHLPDSLRYGADVDTAGAFTLRRLPVGSSLAIGYEDRNGNRRADRFDRADTVVIELVAEGVETIEFSVFQHDTIGPALSRVEALDSLTLELTFDGHLNPEARLDASSFVVLYGSTPIPVDTVLHNWGYRDWLVQQAARPPLDTLDALQPIDSLEARPPGPEAVPPPEELLPQEEALEPERLPARRLVLVLAEPLRAGEYLVRAERVVNLTGLAAGSELRYVHEEPEAEGGDERE